MPDAVFPAFVPAFSILFRGMWHFSEERYHFLSIRLRLITRLSNMATVTVHDTPEKGPV